jgi:hypothetical protein
VHNIVGENRLSKRAWLAFAAVQVIGCILAFGGAMYRESVFVCGFRLLLPGYLAAMVLTQKLPGLLFFPVTVACNATFWVTCAAVWRILRLPKRSTFDRYAIALAAAGLVFAAANTVHFLRPVTCSDCFFPYGVPFTLYRHGGRGGGGGLVFQGLAADTLVLIICAALFGGLWQWLAAKRG